MLQEYLGFLLAVSEAVRGKKIQDKDFPVSETVTRLMRMLVRVSLLLGPSWMRMRMETPTQMQLIRFIDKPSA